MTMILHDLHEWLIWGLWPRQRRPDRYRPDPLRSLHVLHGMGKEISRVKWKSKRADGRGHRPKGVRTHPNNPVGGFRSVSHLCRRVISEASRVQLGTELARFCRVHRKTLWRWQTGEDIPAPPRAKRLLAWHLHHG